MKTKITHRDALNAREKLSRLQDLPSGAMTLREHYAGLFMQALLNSNVEFKSSEDRAERAVEHADLLLAALATIAPLDTANRHEKAVIDELAKLGIRATLDYPGFINIPTVGALTWAWGTINPQWCGDLTDFDGNSIENATLQFASTSTDYKAIADAIAAHIHEYANRS